MKITKTPAKKGSEDKLRFKNNQMHFSLNVLNGKQGDFYISFCPALNLSGYGKTKIAAEKFLEVELQTFAEDVGGMTMIERENYLRSIGFHKEPLRNKNFSKAYVDEHGALQDFEEGTLERNILTYA